MRCCADSRPQVGQALPLDEILRARDAGLGHRRGGVARGGLRVLALGAEEPVDPAVLVRGEPHVVDVGVGVVGLRHDHRVVPEAEAVDAVLALGDGEEALAVVAFDAGHQVHLAVPLDGAGVEDAVDPQPLQQERVASRVEVVAPEERACGRGQHRVLPAVEDAVAVLDLVVLPLDERRVLVDLPAQGLLEVECH